MSLIDFCCPICFWASFYWFLLLNDSLFRHKAILTFCKLWRPFRLIWQLRYFCFFFMVGFYPIVSTSGSIAVNQSVFLDFASVAEWYMKRKVGGFYTNFRHLFKSYKSPPIQLRLNLCELVNTRDHVIGVQIESRNSFCQTSVATVTWQHL